MNGVSDRLPAYEGSNVVAGMEDAHIVHLRDLKGRRAEWMEWTREAVDWLVITAGLPNLNKTKNARNQEIPN